MYNDLASFHSVEPINVLRLSHSPLRHCYSSYCREAPSAIGSQEVDEDSVRIILSIVYYFH